MLLRHNFSILIPFFLTSSLVYSNNPTQFEYYSIKDRIAFLALQRKCYEVSVENTEATSWCDLLEKEYNMLEDCQNLDLQWASYSEKQTCKIAERFKKSSQQEKCRSPKNQFQQNRCDMIRRCPIVARSFNKITDYTEKLLAEQKMGVCKAANTKDPVKTLKPEAKLTMNAIQARLCPEGFVPVFSGKGKGKNRQKRSDLRRRGKGKGKFGKGKGKFGKFGKGKFGKGKFGKGKFGKGKFISRMGVGKGGKGAHFVCVKDKSDQNANIAVLVEREKKHQQALEQRKLQAKRQEDKIQAQHNREYRKQIKQVQKELKIQDQIEERERAEKERKLDEEAAERKAENLRLVQEHEAMLAEIERQKQLEAKEAEDEEAKKQAEEDRLLELELEQQRKEQAIKDREEAEIRRKEALEAAEREKLEIELEKQRLEEERLLKEEEERIRKEQEVAEKKRLKELEEYKKSLKAHKKALADYKKLYLSKKYSQQHHFLKFFEITFFSR